MLIAIQSGQQQVLNVFNNGEISTSHDFSLQF